MINIVKYKIEYVESECNGDGVCAGLCSENWEMVERDGRLKAKPKNIETDELGCNMDAAEQCPANCIHIIEIRTGRRLI